MPSSKVSSNDTPTKHHIHLVDDSKVVISALQSSLEEKGYHVTSSLNGDDAIITIRKEKPTLIVLDVEMPIMDGYQTIKVLKSEKETANIPVIFHTSLREPEVIERLFKLGASDYITKPYIPVELFARVEKEIKNITLQQMLKEKMSRLAENLSIDPLTKSSNKTHMTSLISSALTKLEKDNSGAFSLMYIDIDEFNAFSKKSGVNGADIALKKCNMVFRRCIRNKDVLSRWEGDVFIIMLPQIINEDLNNIAKKIRDSIKKIPFEHDLRLSGSISMIEVSSPEKIASILSTLKVRINERKKTNKGFIIKTDGKLLI